MNRYAFSLAALSLGLALAFPPAPACAGPDQQTASKTAAAGKTAERRADLRTQNWYLPCHAGPSMVNVSLIPGRVLKSADDAWNGQTVLWEGRIIKHYKNINGRNELLLGTEAGSILVKYANPARNLEYDRTGCRVAVKGALRIKNSRLQYLAGTSCILLEPPKDYGFQRWLNGRSPSAQEFLEWRLLFHNPESDMQKIKAAAKSLLRNCAAHNVEPALMASLIQIESAWDSDAVSPSGACGLGQLMPRTAEGLGVDDPMDPAQNLDGAVTMTGRLVRAWENGCNPYASVLASYNAGPTIVKSLGGRVPPYAETTNYVYFIGFVRRDMLKQAHRLHVPGLEYPLPKVHSFPVQQAAKAE